MKNVRWLDLPLWPVPIGLSASTLIIYIGIFGLHHWLRPLPDYREITDLHFMTDSLIGFRRQLGAGMDSMNEAEEIELACYS